MHIILLIYLHSSITISWSTFHFPLLYLQAPFYFHDYLWCCMKCGTLWPSAFFMLELDLAWACTGLIRTVTVAVSSSTAVSGRHCSDPVPLCFILYLPFYNNPWVLEEWTVISMLYLWLSIRYLSFSIFWPVVGLYILPKIEAFLMRVKKCVNLNHLNLILFPFCRITPVGSLLWPMTYIITSLWSTNYIMYEFYLVEQDLNSIRK